MTALYTSLDVAQRTIRLLLINPATDQEDPLECTLEEVRLNDTSRQPYQALSYVWGDQTETMPARVNGIKVRLGINLTSALRHLRQEDGIPRLWADAICINQADQEEKGSQVAMMADIYREAESVIVWLGDESHDSRLAMRTVEEFGPPEFERRRSLLDTITEQGFDGFETRWTALNNLFNRPYWCRRWVFQEVLLGRSVKLHCGSDVVDWDSFQGLEEAWYQVMRKVDGWLPITLAQQDMIKESGVHVLQTFSNFDTKNKWKKVSRSMMHLLQGTTRLQCADPRDHIYALRGLADDADRFPAPNYAKSVEQVYVEFARAHIHLTGTLDILGEAAIRAAEGYVEMAGGLPSWVPDWRVKPIGIPLHISDVYNACKGATGDVDKIPRSWEDGRSALKVRGVIVDTIEVVHTSQELLGSPMTMIFVLVSGITMGKDPIHPSGFPFLNVFLKTVLLDIDYRFRSEHVSLTHEEKDLPSVFFQLAEAFLLLVCIEWGHLRDIVFPGEVEQVMFDLNLRFLQEGSELARQYPKFETVKSFREAVRAEGREGLALTLPTLNTVQEAINKYTTSGKALIQTERDLFGMATRTAKEGDVVAVLQGYRAPVILRQEGEGWTLVGDAFVYGLMDGEAFDSENKRLSIDLSEPQDLIII